MATWRKNNKLTQAELEQEFMTQEAQQNNQEAA